ncbi:HAMP domain-containing sensor histidine kinase [soil metagenome]
MLFVVGGGTLPPAATIPAMSALLTPDEELLRRFGYVRAAGLVAYLVAVVVLFGIFGGEVWPLLIGVPVLVAATVGYFLRSARSPRGSVLISLLADAIVLGGAVAFVGGTSRGLVMLYGIVIVSAGILLGPLAALSFAVLCGLLAVGQLVVEELGMVPSLLFRPDLDERVPILLISIAGLASVGYLTATYASRLHELVALGRDEAAEVQLRGRRRRLFVQQASLDVRAPLRELEQVAGVLDASRADLRDAERSRLAHRLRASVTRLEAEVGVLSDVGALDAVGDQRPEPVELARVVEDVVSALGDRLDGYVVDAEVPALKVVGDRRGARRIAYSLLENVVEHTPSGTVVRVTAVTTAGRGVLVVTDNGPGIAAGVADGMFAAPEEKGSRVGLPLVAELCAAMGAEVRYEPAPAGGARFLVAFRLAPAGAPTTD